jgi:hypothetical protein
MYRPDIAGNAPPVRPPIREVAALADLGDGQVGRAHTRISASLPVAVAAGRSSIRDALAIYRSRKSALEELQRPLPR